MAHPLQTRIGALRIRLRGLLAVYGLGWWLACTMGVVIAAGLADYAIRFRDPGIRVLATLAVCVVVSWAAFRFLYRPWTPRLGDVDLARRVQSRFPALGDDLASAVEFLQADDDDPAAGSPALRHAVVARALDASAEIDFRFALRARPAWRAVLVGSLAALFAAVLAAADPVSARIAVLRLTRPWAEIPWPQVYHLAIRNPVDRVARGQPFEVEVINATGSRLPDDARIFYRFQSADGEVAQESEPMRLYHGMLVARRERVTRPFSFRVEGGDDRSMPWRPVDVVDPPSVVSFRATLIPPAYTGWPPTQSEGNIRALAGTRVELVAAATKPLAAASVLLDRGIGHDARVTDDGLRFVVPADPATPWILDQSGSYGFRLTDREGITDGEGPRWEIRAVADAPPRVVLEKPDYGPDWAVAPDARVAIAAVASDDLAIQRVDLCFTRSDHPTEPAVKKPLYAGPRISEAKKTAGLELGDADRRVVEAVWTLDDLKLPPGIQLDFWIEAADYKPQTATSAVKRLSIVTREELARRLLSREDEILSELSRVLAMQRQGREQVAVLQRRAAEPASFRSADFDRLRGTELNQRLVERGLSARQEGISSLILRLLADLETNRLDVPGVRERLAKTLAALDRLATRELPAVGRELTAAIKAAEVLLESRDAPRSAADVQKSLAAAGKNQDAIIAALEKMVEKSGQAHRVRQLSAKIDELAREQDELAARVADLARQTLGKRLQDLAPPEAAERADMAARQAALARRFDAIEQAMVHASTRDGEDPAAVHVSEALRRAQQVQPAGQMRAASDQIRENQLSQAAELQGRASAALREIAEVLAGRSSGKSADLSLVLGGPLLEEIRQRQEEINRLTRALETSIAPAVRSNAEARRRYEQLSRDQAELAERLQKLFSPPPEERKP